MKNEVVQNHIAFAKNGGNNIDVVTQEVISAAKHVQIGVQLNVYLPLALVLEEDLCQVRLYTRGKQLKQHVLRRGDIQRIIDAALNKYHNCAFTGQASCNIVLRLHWKVGDSPHVRCGTQYHHPTGGRRVMLCHSCRQALA